MLIVREMYDSDVKEVAQIEEKVFSMPWSEEAFREMIKCPDAYYVVAEEEGQILGCCGVRNILGEGEITNVVVMNEYQNRGIGRMMLEYLLEKGRNAGVEAFILEVRKSNENAIHLYEKLGFVTEGIRKNFYEKPVEDGLIMWKRVKQQLENSDYN